MLDPWIIEEIKRKEQRGRIEQPVVEVPIQGPDGRDRERGTGSQKPSNDEEAPRGVVIIDFGVSSW